MKLSVQVCSHVGRVRSENQDMAVIGTRFFRDASGTIEMEAGGAGAPFLAAVADGMGGHQGGDYASELVCQRVSATVEALEPDITFPMLRDVLTSELTRLHEVLIREGNDDPAKAGMGTTFTGLIIAAPLVAFIHVGDSRLYRLRDGLLAQLTRDHSLRALTGNPDVPPNLIANSVGGGDSIFVDCKDLTGRLLEGDAYLLCSDGLNTHVADDEIEAVLAAGGAVDSLIEAAISGGGTDNISLVRIEIQGD